MANEASVGLNGLIERMQSADHAIEQSRGALRAHLDGMEQLFDPGNRDDPAEAPDVDTEAEALDAAVSAASDTLQGRFGDVLDALRGVHDDNAARLTEASSTWDDTASTADEDLNALQEAFEAASERTRDAVQSLIEAYEAAKVALGEAQDATDDALATAESAVSGELASAFQDQATRFLTDLADNQTARLRDGVEDAQRQAEEILNRLSETCTQLLTDFEQQLADALQSLAERVGQHLRSEIENAAREIVEEAVRELSYAIMEAIAASQIGASVTAAMSPVLPELIAAKRLTDVILEAIRIWKETVGRLTSFF